MATFCITNRNKSLNGTEREITMTYARANILAARILISKSQLSKETSILFMCPKHISCEGSSPLGLMFWILNYLDKSSYTHCVEMPTRKGRHGATKSMVTDGRRANKYVPLNRSHFCKVDGYGYDLAPYFRGASNGAILPSTAQCPYRFSGARCRYMKFGGPSKKSGKIQRTTV